MYPNMKSSMLHVSTGSAQRWLLLPAFAAVLALFSVGCGHKNLLAPKESAASSAMVGQRLPAQMQALGEPVAALHTEGVSESGAIWAIDRPAHWNGDLVLYAHGYTNPSEPVALPNYFALRDSLLARGYAVAASSSLSPPSNTIGMAVNRAVLAVRRSTNSRRDVSIGSSLGGRRRPVGH